MGMGNITHRGRSFELDLVPLFGSQCRWNHLSIGDFTWMKYGASPPTPTSRSGPEGIIWGIKGEA